MDESDDLTKRIFSDLEDMKLVRHTVKDGIEGFEITEFGLMVRKLLNAFPSDAENIDN